MSHLFISLGTACKWRDLKDPYKTVWTNGKSMPKANYNFPLVAIPNQSKALAIFGKTSKSLTKSNSCSTSIMEFNSDTKTWTENFLNNYPSDLSNGLAEHCTTFVKDTIWIIGGHNCKTMTSTKQVWSLDVYEKTLTETNQLPEAIATLACTTVSFRSYYSSSQPGERLREDC